MNSNEQKWIISVLEKIIELNAVNPAFGGPGEANRANYIEELIADMGFNAKRYDFEDTHGRIRSNLLVEVGNGDKVWLVAHLDTVSAGEGWTKKPFELTVEGDKVYGRGVSDNGIGIISLLLLLRRISEERFEPKKRILFLFAADEESGSTYGVKALIKKGVISGGSAIIPDFGNKNGELVEIAEKGILWLKITINGKQGHASMPHKADNANLKASKFIVEMYEYLHKKFSKQNEFFDPPYSTFQPTKREANVESINIIPGVDISYWDCRILPEYTIDDVINAFKEKLGKFDATMDIVIKEEASLTNPDEWVVSEITKSIETVLGIKPRLIGIGGGTVAGIFRKIGIPSVAWGVMSETEHKPDEFEYIENYIKTANVLEKLLSA